MEEEAGFRAVRRIMVHRTQNHEYKRDGELWVLPIQVKLMPSQLLVNASLYSIFSEHFLLLFWGEGEEGTVPRDHVSENTLRELWPGLHAEDSGSLAASLALPGSVWAQALIHLGSFLALLFCSTEQSSGPRPGASLTRNDEERKVTCTLIMAAGDLLFLLLFDES